MKKFLSLVCLAFSFSVCHCKMIQVDSMQEVAEHFKNADQETLAIFDIDNVIVIPSDPAFQMANMKQHSQICKKIINDIPASHRDVFMVLTSIDSKSVLIDTECLVLLNALLEKKVPKMALTGNFTGKFRDIEKMEEWKINSLNELGVDFSTGCPNSQHIVFKDLPSYRGYQSIYTKGVLFVNGSVCTKGEALVAFLKITKLNPRKIIFVDDREEHVKSVEAALVKYDPSVSYIGIHFTGAKNFPSTPISAEQFETRWQEVALKAQLLK